VAPIKPNPYVKNDTRAAARILRDSIYSLLDSGFEQQQVAAALDILIREARGGDWQDALAARTRARHLKR
jgi:hypothetical protein